MSHHKKPRATATSDYARFVTFFAAMGVVHTAYRDCRSRPVQTLGMLSRCHVITTGQAHFIFDLDGRYLGVEQDEMGGFDPRQELASGART